MTVTPSSIDLRGLLEEQLLQASPDLICDLLQLFINTLLSAEADAVCGAEYGQTSDARGEPAQRLPAPGLRHPRRNPGRGRTETAGEAPTSPIGCWSGANEPNEH